MKQEPSNEPLTVSAPWLIQLQYYRLRPRISPVHSSSPSGQLSNKHATLQNNFQPDSSTIHTSARDSPDSTPCNPCQTQTRQTDLPRSRNAGSAPGSPTPSAAADTPSPHTASPSTSHPPRSPTSLACSSNCRTATFTSWSRNGSPSSSRHPCILHLFLMKMPTDKPASPSAASDTPRLTLHARSPPSSTLF